MQVSPKVVNIELTNHCNANCKMCTHTFMKREKGFMSREAFKIIADKLSKIDTIESIQLHGHGESFLHKDIEQFANYIKGICPNKEIAVITNGVLIKKIPEGFDRIIISFMGGDKETYEKMMKLNFENAIETIKAITPRNKIILQMLLCKSNIHSKADFEKLWAGWKTGTHDAYYNWCSEDIPYDGIRPLPESGVCKRLYVHMSIHWNGIVNLCTQDYEQSVPIGNMVTEDVLDIYNSHIVKLKRNEQAIDIFSGICENCAYCKWEKML